MSLWSLEAAKKKEEVPGTSKWIRKELFALHGAMAKDVEQFAYSVASEFTWIDEQMDEILNSSEDNPRLLLESPAKLRGENSPVKHIRDHALAIKSPLKEVDMNALNMSPIKFNRPESPLRPQHQALSPAPSPSPSPQRKSPMKPIASIPKINFSIPALQQAEFNSPFAADIYRDTPEKVEVKEKEGSKVIDKEIEDKQTLFNKAGEGKDDSGQREHSIPFSIEKDLVPIENSMYYDASAEEISFQAIKSAIRKSIIQKSKASEECTENLETSFKSTSEEVPAATSLVVNQGSSDATEVTQKSTETLKVPLKDESYTESPQEKYRKASHTPPQASHRESQGFALLPHRGPLTVKSAKKKENTRKSLFDDLEISNNEGKHKPENTKIAKSLYPTITFEDNTSSIPTTATSPLQKLSKKMEQEKEDKAKETQLQPLKSRLNHPQKPISPSEIQSPTKTTESSPSKGYSPLSHIFNSVGTTLKKARSKFLKETEQVFDDNSKIQKPARRSSLGRPVRKDAARAKSPKKPTKSPSKRVISENDSEVLSRLTVPTEVSQAKTIKKLEDVPPSPEKAPLLESPIYENNNENDFNNSVNDDLTKRSSLKFSPVKSIYGSLRREMNKTVNSPAKDEKEDKAKKLNLARKSLTKPMDENEFNRKSFKGGLASMPLEPKQKNRAKSFASEQQNRASKRKTQTEDEARTTTSSSNQAYRKIGTKIVPPTANQSKPTQQDAKRRRTAEQLQSVLQKRAFRVSNVANNLADQMYHNEEQAKQNARPQADQNQTKPLPSNQTLMKTAVLQHARMKNETKSANPFQSNSNFGSSSTVINRKAPKTPTTPTVLPEIFSESDDDEEGSVLKDWANSPELRNILLNQRYVDPDRVFGPMAPLQMEEIFKSSTTRLSRLKHRGSSALWTGTDALTLHEVETYRKKFKR